jgi:hypothetical protein
MNRNTATTNLESSLKVFIEITTYVVNFLLLDSLIYVFMTHVNMINIKIIILQIHQFELENYFCNSRVLRVFHFILYYL